MRYGQSLSILKVSWKLEISRAPSPFSRFNEANHNEFILRLKILVFKTLSHTCVIWIPFFHNIQVIGPMADEYDQIFGNLPPVQDRSFSKTPLQGLQDIFKYLHFNRVCKAKTKCVSYNATLAKDTVKNKDLIIAIFGTGIYQMK